MAAGGNTVAALVSGFNKKNPGTASKASDLSQNVERIPFGIFPADLCTGGGLPRGRTSIIFGPESSGKTNLALRAIAMHQQIYPELTCAFIDVEHALMPSWAKKLGVDTDRLIICNPTFAEEAVDQAEALMYAKDIGMVVVDSLAALVSTTEVDNDASTGSYGGTSILVGKLVRKTGAAMNEQGKAGLTPTLVYINQIRFKMGVAKGQDPETMPGGNAPRFQSAMTIRTYGKNIVDAKVNKTMPVIKQTSFIVRKWKVPIYATHGVFDMVTIPHEGYNVGDVSDFNSIVAYLKEFGWLRKPDKGAGWMLFEAHIDTQAKILEMMIADPVFSREIKAKIIERCLTMAAAGGELPVMDNVEEVAGAPEPV